MIDTSKKFEDLTFIDDFMFALVNEKNPNIAKGEIELLTGEKVNTLQILKSQYSLPNSLESKSVRFDIYGEDEESNKHYDMEMQATRDPDLIKRVRYYASSMDTDSISKGQTYRDLSEACVIFICAFKPFPNQNSAIYIERDRLFKTGKNGEEDITEETQYETGCVKIYLDTTVDLETVENEDLRAFIQFIRTRIATNEFTKEIESTVREQKQNSLERTRYMTFQQELKMREDVCFEQGIEKGKKEGIEETKKIAAIGFYAKGLSISDIAEVLHLTIEKVKEIISSNSSDSDNKDKQ